MLLASYVYRLVNRVDSFVATGFPIENNLGLYFKTAKQIVRSKQSFFTAAHQTTHFKKFKQYVQHAVEKKLLDEVCDNICKADSLKECCRALQKLRGIGKFLSWQILCDLRESRCIELNDDFCLLGPGAHGKWKVQHLCSHVKWHRGT